MRALVRFPDGCWLSNMAALRSSGALLLSILPSVVTDNAFEEVIVLQASEAPEWNLLKAEMRTLLMSMKKWNDTS